MAPRKSIDRKSAQRDTIPALTPCAFARAAGLANLIVATLVFFEFCAIALFNRDGEAFLLGLSLIPLVTVLIWITATAFCVAALTPSWLSMLGRRLTGTSRLL